MTSQPPILPGSRVENWTCQYEMWPRRSEHSIQRGRSALIGTKGDGLAARESTPPPPATHILSNVEASIDLLWVT